VCPPLCFYGLALISCTVFDISTKYNLLQCPRRVTVVTASLAATSLFPVSALPASPNIVYALRISPPNLTQPSTSQQQALCSASMSLYTSASRFLFLSSRYRRRRKPPQKSRQPCQKDRPPALTIADGGDLPCGLSAFGLGG
jgi:hypothetical protein